MPVPLRADAEHFSVAGIQRRKQRGGPVALVIMGHCLASSAPQQQTGLRSIQCLYLAFLVNAQDDGMFRGLRYRPTIASNCSANFGSLLTLKVSTGCGFRPCARQMRSTLESLMPRSAAIERVD